MDLIFPWDFSKIAGATRHFLMLAELLATWQEYIK